MKTGPTPEQLAELELIRADQVRLADSLRDDIPRLPVGSIVALPNGPAWLLRSDGWYMGDDKQPDAHDFGGYRILRYGWLGSLPDSGPATEAGQDACQHITKCADAACSYRMAARAEAGQETSE